MKIRNGFVSNSSSSSFICDVCGSCESGMDVSVRDCGMIECENGHTFCEEHNKNVIKNVPAVELRKYISEYIKENVENDVIMVDIDELDKTKDEDLMDFYNDNCSDDYNELPSMFCPICTFTELDDSDAFLYLKRKNNLSNEGILNSIKEEFKSYTEFKKFLFE